MTDGIAKIPIPIRPLRFRKEAMKVEIPFGLMSGSNVNSACSFVGDKVL